MQNELQIESHQLWWAMLLKRTLELANLLPSDLVGNVQFEVERDRGDTARFHLMLRGPRTRGAGGVIAPVDVLVRTSSSKLQALLFAKRVPADALVVSGNTDLFFAFFAFLKNKPAPKSMLQLRGES